MLSEAHRICDKIQTIQYLAIRRQATSALLRHAPDRLNRPDRRRDNGQETLEVDTPQGGERSAEDDLAFCPSQGGTWSRGPEEAEGQEEDREVGLSPQAASVGSREAQDREVEGRETREVHQFREIEEGTIEGPNAQDGKDEARALADHHVESRQAEGDRTEDRRAENGQDQDKDGEVQAARFPTGGSGRGAAASVAGPPAWRATAPPAAARSPAANAARRRHRALARAGGTDAQAATCQRARARTGAHPDRCQRARARTGLATAGVAASTRRDVGRCRLELEVGFRPA